LHNFNETSVHYKKQFHSQVTHLCSYVQKFITMETLPSKNVGPQSPLLLGVCNFAIKKHIRKFEMHLVRLLGKAKPGYTNRSNKPTDKTAAMLITAQNRQCEFCSHEQHWRRIL